jgi:hypothetical protein
VAAQSELQLCGADASPNDPTLTDTLTRVTAAIPRVLADGTVQGQQNYKDQGPVAPMRVSSTGLTARTCNAARTTASIFGRATINGAASHLFQIDVTDMGAGGSNDTYGITLDTGYTSGQHRLGGGTPETVSKTRSSSTAPRATGTKPGSSGSRLVRSSLPL